MISWSAPDPHLELIHVANIGDLLILTVKSIRTSACCPSCKKISARSHSRYSRKVQDLPISDQAVQLLLLSRKWVCVNENCPKRIFAERFEGISTNSRRTLRAERVLRKIAFSTSCLSGEKVAHAAHIPVSHDTLLSIIQRTNLSPQVSPFCRVR